MTGRDGAMWESRPTRDTEEWLWFWYRVVETKNEEVFVETPVEEKEEPESADPENM